MDAIACQIVDRLHVSTSPLQVCRVLRSQMQRSRRTDPAFREMRKVFYRAGLAQHAKNRKLYARVMGGNL